VVPARRAALYRLVRPVDLSVRDPHTRSACISIPSRTALAEAGRDFAEEYGEGYVVGAACNTVPVERRDVGVLVAR